MWIAYGDQDQLAESSRLGAAHLEKAGVDVHLECHPGQGHGFFNFPKRPESKRLRAHITAFHERRDVDRAHEDGAGGPGA